METNNNAQVETLVAALRKQFDNVGFNDKTDTLLSTYIAGGKYAAQWHKEQSLPLINSNKKLLEALKSITEIARWVEDNTKAKTGFISKIKYAEQVITNAEKLNQ